MSGSNYTLTPNYGLFKPVPNADNDVWGDHINASMDTLDSTLKTIENKAGVTSWNTRTGVVSLTNADVLGVLPGSNAQPAMDGLAAAGTATTWSRADHVHPVDTSRYAASNPAGYVTAAGAATAAPMQSWNTRTGAVTLSNADVTAVLPASSTTPGMDGTAAVGTGTTWARSDHIHPTDTSRYAASNPSGYQTAAQVVTAVAPALNDVGRNLIHNPLFNVAQRGAGPFTASGAAADRWPVNASDTISVTIASASDSVRTAIGDEAAQNFIANTFTGNAAAGSYIQLIQRMENVRRLGNKTVTVSFWANCGAGALKLGVSLDQGFGTGGSPSAAVSGVGQAVTLSTVWTRYTLTFNIPGTAGKTIGTAGNDYTVLNFWYNAGSTYSGGAGFVGPQSGSINLWGAQLEVGTVATPLEKPDPATDLAKCQRFYQTGSLWFYGYSTAGSAIGYAVPLSTAMRSAPTVALNNMAFLNSTLAGSGMTGAAVYAYVNVTATGPAQFNGNFTASADL